MNLQSKRSTRCISVLLLCLLLPWNIIFSCGPMLSNDEKRFLLFNSELDGNNGMKAISTSETLFDIFDADKQPDYKRNCREWVAYTNHQVTEKDVFTIQYKTAPSKFLEAYNHNTWTAYKGNSFVHWLTQKENRSSLDYMAVAKQAEAADALLNSDPWDTTLERTKHDVAAIANLAFKRISGSPVYLQQRYAFQAIKLWSYLGNGLANESNLQNVYLNNLEGRNTIVAAWAKIYYAMVQSDPNRRTLYLLKAFNESDEKKQFSYLRIDKKDLVALRRVTTDAYTNSLIESMSAMKSKGRALEHIKAIAKYDSKSKLLSMLVGREVNKLESWLWTPELLGFYDAYTDGREEYTKIQLHWLQTKDLAYLGQVSTFLETFNTKNANPALQLALIHLYNIGHNYVKAGQLLKRLPVYTSRSYETQRLIEQVIITSHTEDIMVAHTKQKLAASMNKLLQMNSTYRKQLDAEKYDRWEDDEAERSDDISELLLLLSGAYEKKGDRLTAGLLYTKANITTNTYDGWAEKDIGYSHIAWYDRFATPDDIDGVLTLKHKTNKTAFDKLLTPTRWAKDDMYKDLKGTILFRQHQYAKALSVFKSMDPNFWNDNYEYKNYLPLTPITYTGMIPSANTIKPCYKIASKLLIVQDVVNIAKGTDNAKDNETRAAGLYKLGNVQVNTSYNGKAWMMFSYGKSTNEPNTYDQYPDVLWAFYNFYPNDLKYGDDYYMCRSAIENYAKAFSLSNDKELKAKCLLGLVTCQSLTNYNVSNEVRPPYMKSRNITAPFLQQLKNYYNTTAFKLAAVHCPDIKEYVARSN